MHRSVNQVYIIKKKKNSAAFFERLNIVVILVFASNNIYINLSFNFLFCYSLSVLSFICKTEKKYIFLKVAKSFFKFQ